MKREEGWEVGYSPFLAISPCFLIYIFMYKHSAGNLSTYKHNLQLYIDVFNLFPLNLYTVSSSADTVQYIVLQ
jgi:hypothetical protein